MTRTFSALARVTACTPCHGGYGTSCFHTNQGVALVRFPRKSLYFGSETRSRAGMSGADQGFDDQSSLGGSWFHLWRRGIESAVCQVKHSSNGVRARVCLVDL